MRHIIMLAGIVSLGLLPVNAALGDEIADCGQSRNLEARVRACTQIIGGSGYNAEQKAVAYRHRGQARAAAGANDQAITDLSEALRLDPQDAAAYDARAHARLAKGAVDQAISDLSAAVRLSPQNVSYLVARGHAFLVKGNADGAIIDFSAAIRINPNSASAFNNKGLAWRKKNNFDQAIADYTTAIGLNPIYAVAYLNRGYAYEASGRQAEAVGDFTRALEIDRTLIGASAALKRLRVSTDIAARSERAVVEGKELAEKNCAACHAVGTSGFSPNVKAPEFRVIQERHPILALREPLARSIAAPHDVMPQFLLPEADIDRIVAYINSLQNARRGWEAKSVPRR